MTYLILTETNNFVAQSTICPADDVENINYFYSTPLWDEGGTEVKILGPDEHPAPIPPEPPIPEGYPNPLKLDTGKDLLESIPNSGKCSLPSINIDKFTGYHFVHKLDGTNQRAIVKSFDEDAGKFLVELVNGGGKSS